MQSQGICGRANDAIPQSSSLAFFNGVTHKFAPYLLAIQSPFHYAFVIFTDVIVSEPATALSLNKVTSSFSSFNASAYNSGR